MIDGHHVMRPQRCKSDLEHIARAPPGVEDGAATALAMSINERIDQLAGRREPHFRERLDHEAALPIAVAGRRPMLQGAAPAGSEMGADSGDALAARDLDLEEMAAVGMARPCADLGDLARQRVGHIERARLRLCDAVATPADACDVEPFNHAWHRAGIRDCRRGRGSGRR